MRERERERKRDRQSKRKKERERETLNVRGERGGGTEDKTGWRRLAGIFLLTTNSSLDHQQQASYVQ